MKDIFPPRALPQRQFSSNAPVPYFMRWVLRRALSLPDEFARRVPFGSRRDLQEIFNRFEDYRPGFGAEFMTVVDAYLARIAVFPEIAPIYFESIRRQVMQRFPYGIFYEAQPTRILVAAILDLRQDEEQILRRLRH